jgi:serine/threonine protein kinase
MFEKAASLVSQLHQQGVAHCDVKPDNLLLLDGELMLSDFSEALAFTRPEQAFVSESR